MLKEELLKKKEEMINLMNEVGYSDENKKTILSKSQGILIISLKTIVCRTMIPNRNFWKSSSTGKRRKNQSIL